MCAAPREREILKEHDLSAWSMEAPLSTSTPSDARSNRVASMSLKSPSSSSPLSSVQSPALRGSRLQQLEHYEAINGRLPTTSPRKPLSTREHESSPGKLHSSDTNSVTTPTSHTKSTTLVCVCFFNTPLFAVLGKTASTLFLKFSFKCFASRKHLKIGILSFVASR